ncbi:Pol protein, partial [Globisporangium splendens]
MASVWSEHFTKEGRVYYYNRSTKQSSWEKPADFDGESSASASGDVAKQTSGGASENSKKAQTKGDAEWEELWDPKNERPYYYNRATRKTQWLRPENVEIKPYGGAAAATGAVAKKTESSSKAKKSAEKSNGSAATSTASETATATSSTSHASAKATRRGSVDHSHHDKKKDETKKTSPHGKKEHAAARKEDRERDAAAAHTKKLKQTVKEGEDSVKDEESSSQRDDAADEENEDNDADNADAADDQNGHDDDAPALKKRKKKTKKDKEKGEIDSNSSNWRKKRRVKDMETRMIICDDDDRMQSRTIQEKDTEDGKEATRLLQELSKTDAIMEMNVLNVINGFLRAHNESNGPEILVEALSSSYRGHAQMVSLVASWLDTLPVSKSALEKKVTYDVSEGAVHENKGASWDPAEDILYQHLKDVVAEHYDPTLVYEKQMLAENAVLIQPLSACSLLQYAIRRISDAGHHKEIASITNANAFFTVFSGVLVDSFCRIPFASEEEACEDIAALNKICCQSAYSYLYAEELLCTMDNKLYLLQSGAESHEAVRYRVARSKLSRVHFELQETAVEKFGAKVGVFHPLRRRHLFDSNPRLSDAILSIIKTKKCSEIAAEVLAKEYRITKTPPPVAHLRDPITAKSSNASAPVEIDEEAIEDIKKALLEASAICKSDHTLGYNMNQSGVVEKLISAMRVPVVSMGVLHWLEVILKSPAFFNSTLLHICFPSLLRVLKASIKLHTGQWPIAFRVLVTSLRLHPEINPVKALELKRESLRSMVFMITSGYVLPVLEFVFKNTVELDQALLRNFITMLFAQIAAPYSSSAERNQVMSTRSEAEAQELRELLPQERVDALVGPTAGTDHQLTRVMDEHIHFERSFQRPSEVKRFDDAALSTSSIPVQDPASILVLNMDATGTPLGPAVPETVELTIEGFPHLSSHEWVALERVRDVIGEAAVVSLLRSASPEDQKSAVVSFMHHEIMSSRKQVATPVSSLRTVPLKLDVSPYRGGENEPLSRWFVELDAAITARQLRDPSQQVLFAMSNLAGRAKSWAYGKRLADLNCFPSYDHFKTELKKAFEPQQSEFRARAEFLKLRQGRFDLHSYAQRARYLVSSIVDEPIDVPMQVVTFMTGLNDGPIRNQLFREYPKTLDEAIERAMQEEFSIKQAKFHGFALRPMRQSNVAHDGPEPMDISYISTPGNERPRNDGKCFRCGKPGHIARNCKVSLPGRQMTQDARSNNHDRSYGLGEGTPTGPEKRTVDVVETQDSGPYVHQAYAVSTMSEKSVSQTSSLIVHKVHVDGIATPLRALVDTGASNNFVRNEVIIRHGVFVPDANEEKTMIVRLANGSTVKMPKRVVRLAIKCEDFRGEDEFILLDLDDKFDIILGMPWLKRYQPSIDWMNMKISVGKSRDVDLCCTTTDEVVWVYTSVEEIPDGPCDVAVCDGPPCSQVVPILKTTNGGGAVRRQKKTVSFAIDDEKVHDGVDKSEWKRNKHPSQDKKKKTSKRSFAPRVLSTPDQGTSGDDEGSVQAQDIPSEFVNVAVYNEEGDVDVIRHVKIENPPSSVEELISLPPMSKKTLERSLARGNIAQVCVIVEMVDEGFVNTASSADADVLDEKARKERFEEQSWDALKKNPVYALAREYEDIFPDKVPDELPFDRGIRHEIDVLPGTKYCITRQWPLPKEQVEAIDEFFAQRAKAGHVRESKSPHCSPTFCVKKATGGWRIVHAFNKLNDATIPVQTPVPRKDMILDGMVGSTVFSAIDLKDGFYQIRMREDDVPLTTVSTPSGMLWEWLVMPQGLKNAPATFNRMVTNVLRPLRTFAPSYLDDIFVHSKATNGKSDVDVHLDHLRQVFQVMRENKLYANLKKCMFFAPEIPVLGCFVGKNGVRVDPEKVKAIDDWPVPQNVKQLRQWLGLANYLHKYTRNYAALVQPLTQLLKKDVEWKRSKDRETAFEEVKRSLREAPVLALPNHDKPFHVVCDASDYAIGCALMQHDDEGHERAVSYQSRQLRPAERNYPVHDKELLAMKYSLVKFRVYLLGEERFAIYTDHASLRTAVKTPHLSQRMARWFSFFAEYNFIVHYKPGKTNILADALSRRPDYDPKTKSEGTDRACRLCEDVQAIADLLKYFKDPSDKALQGLPSRTRSRVHRFRIHNGMLYYAVEQGDTARVVVPNDEGLRHRLLYEYHDSPSGGHLGREKTFLSLSRDYYWPHMYKWVRKYVRTCEVCQRVKPSGSTQAPLRSLAVPSESWKSVSMDFIFGLPRDTHGRNGILVFVDRFSKMVHLAPVSDKISAEKTAKVFVNVVFRLHGLPVEIVSGRDTRFTSKFWRALLGLLDTKLSMSTAAHPETDGQTERVNRVLEDVLCSYATSFKEWSEFLPLAEFALNNSTHVSTGHSPFYMNYGIHPRVPASIMGEVSTLSGGGTPAHGNKPKSSYDLNAASELKANFDSMKPLDDLTSREGQQVDDFVVRRQAVVRFVRDAIAKAQDLQKEQADKSGRKNKQVVQLGKLEASAKVHRTVQGSEMQW